MFGTFTGNSRRPRNVNLSGQTGNPFSNTSWSPSSVSSATKTVSDAKAERERRLAERQRLRAICKIQQTWRGYRSRKELAESRRVAFDQLYLSINIPDILQRRRLAFKLLIAFFNAKRDDDVRRLSAFIGEAGPDYLTQICMTEVHKITTYKFTEVLVQALGVLCREEPSSPDISNILNLIARISSDLSLVIENLSIPYFTALARLCQTQSGAEWAGVLAVALPLSLQSSCKNVAAKSYKAFAIHFLMASSIHLWEDNLNIYASLIDVKKLAWAILEIYASDVVQNVPHDSLIWLLAHFVALGKMGSSWRQDFIYLNALSTQIASLSPQIRIRVGLESIPSLNENSSEPLLDRPFEPYVKRNLMCLVDHNGIQGLLRDFSYSLSKSSDQKFWATSLLASYILSLLQSFPGSADETRMRLFLEQIPTQTGDVPTVKFLWQIMKQTSIFRVLMTESERPVDVLRKYLRGPSSTASGSVEEQEWPIVLLFLELHIFVLRLSDDEDFFSGMHPAVYDSNPSTSRLRASSLSKHDLEALTTFLKNTAFTLHFKARELSQTVLSTASSSKARHDPNSGRAEGPGMAFGGASLDHALANPRRLDLDSLRGITTTALKMLYERDSRKQFLPDGHWLMTDKLDGEDFVSAAVAEEEGRVQEEMRDSEDEFNEDDDEFDSINPVTYSTGRVSRLARMERFRIQQTRVQKERRLAEMGPKLEILKHMPFSVPFETRVKLFREFIHLDQERRDTPPPWHLGIHYKHDAKVKRGQLFEDAYEQFYQIGDGLKDPIYITFINKFGNPEPGIDGGGVTKEFLTSVTAEAFGEPEKTSFRMFTSNEKGLLYPEPTVIDVICHEMREQGLTESDPEWREEISSCLRRFEFLGRIVGKCLYEGILVDLTFTGFFLLQWTSIGVNGEKNYKGGINDLREMDEELYKGMLRLKNYPGDVSELGFDFTINDLVSGPDGRQVKTVTRNLIANGDKVPVTNDNRLLFISYVARHRLVVQPRLQATAFLRGLQSIIRPSWLSMFNQTELQRLVGGDSSEIDIEDLRRNTVYSGVYEVGDDGEEHPTIKLFWKVMTDFTDAQRRDVIKYVSSTPRAPLLGFSQLRPKFSIRDAGTDQTRLPSTSTCVNLLKLPRYTALETLREKLLYAVTSGAGFDLS